MQKIKNQNGITLLNLVITVTVLGVLATVSIGVGSNIVGKTTKNLLRAELSVVQQAIIAEYSKAEKLGYTNLSEIPENFKGTKIDLTDLPTTITSWKITENPDEAYKAYYELSPKNLEELNIANSKYTYIVNYYTGEVYNKTMNDANLYIYKAKIERKEQQEDNESFNDWIE